MAEQQGSQTMPFRFSGNGGEYFKIWIVNIIFTILTLGIYSAWAKVRTNRYFYGNTSLENSAFEYHATPITILKGRLIAFAVFVIYVLLSKFIPIAGVVFALILMLLMPWAIWRSIQFNARMLSYRNVRFSFHGTLKEAYKILVLIPLLPLVIGAIVGGIAFFALDGGTAAGDTSSRGTVVSAIMAIMAISILVLYLMFPYLQKLMTCYYISNRQYGQGRFTAQLSGKKYYKIYLALIGWTLLWSCLIGLVTGIIMLLTGGGLNMEAIQQNTEKSVMFMASIMLMYILFMCLSLWGTAYMQANIKNYVFNNTKLDDVLQFNSNLKVGKLFGIYLTNTLLVIFTLGLAYPWTVIRMSKYKIESTSATGNIVEYVNQQQKAQSALGEELGDAFDTALDLGM